MSASTKSPDLPFAHYQGRGRELLGRVTGQSGGRSRTGYGRPVFSQCGFACVYCGYRMDRPFEAWLQLSIDHVIPSSAKRDGYTEAWVEDVANMVTCCRACNEWSNDYRVVDPPPTDVAAFFDLRDVHFVRKRELIRSRLAADRNWYDTRLAPHVPRLEHESPTAAAGGDTIPELLRRYAQILRSLRDRGAVRSTNNPISDYAEQLVARAVGLDVSAGSNSGFDARHPGTGSRYQIKARRLTADNRSRQLSFIRGLDGDPFDVLVGVLFEEDFAVLRSAAIPIEVVRRHATRVDYVNGWRLVLADALWEEPGVEDVTDRLRAAAEAWR